MIHSRVVAIVLSSVIFFLVVAFLTSWSNYRRLSSRRICELKGKGADECGKGLAKNGIVWE